MSGKERFGMFKKIHFYLTLLCAGITSFILIFMSLSYFRISEEVLKKSDFLSFQQNMYTIIANLEQQSVIPYELLFKLESNNNYYIYLLDNGHPYLYNHLKDDPVRSGLFEECLKYFEDNISSYEASGILFPENNSLHTEFVYSSDIMKMPCQASVIYMKKGSGLLEIYIISPMVQLANQTNAQRTRFIFIVLSALILLIAFAWIFTKILLKPVENSQRQQTQFVTDASHELRTPLSVILSCASACSMASPEEAKYFLSVIQSEGTRMSSLIDDLLMLGKSDSQSLQYRMEAAELDTLLLKAYEAFEAMAHEKNISLKIFLPSAAVSPCCCDKDRISQLLAILIHNALCYTPEGGIISLSLKEKSSSIRFSVEDNGIGISDEEKKKIFNRFYQSEKSHNSKGHSGLGLSIAYEIIKAHRGSIQVHDTPGGGSTFTFTLPYWSSN